MKTESSGTTLVTGGASGIGLATAGWLLARKHKVLVLDQSAANIDAAKAILRDYGDNVTFAELDVTDEDRMLEIVSSYRRSNGPVAGLVNSAGYGRDIPFLETSTKILRDMMEVNLIGTFSISREVAKLMVASGGGSIVHIASVSGLIGNKGRSAYGATKAALANLTQVMSNELARQRIRVNCVCPGPIETPLAAGHGGAGKLAWEMAVPMNRYGSPSEVASVVGFLSDQDAASYVTGQILSVDGGFISSGLMPA